jgi:hypothetical protein
MDLKTVFLDLVLEGTHGCKEVESSEKLLHALLITQISKEDYTDFLDFSMHF